MNSKTKFIQLKSLYKRLHGPKGCLWDKEQTHRSLLPYLDEETKEFIHAVKKGDYSHIKEELGDILLQVMFHAQIAQGSGKFDIEDVIDTLIKKIKRRHPHVFGNLKVSSTRQIKANWRKVKAREKLLKRSKKHLDK